MNHRDHKDHRENISEFVAPARRRSRYKFLPRREVISVALWSRWSLWFKILLIAAQCCFASEGTIPQKIQKSASLLESGDLKSAAELLQEVLQEDPNHGPANLLLGQILLEQFQWNEAEQHLQIATRSQTRRPHLAWHLLGKLYLLRHEYAKAKDHLDRALKEAPDFQPALIDRARASIFLNDTEGAILDLKSAQESQEAKLLLAELMLYLHNRDPQATETLQSMSATLDAAEWLLQTSKQKLAANLGDHLANDAAYFALGVANLRDKETQQAETLFKIAFALNDQNPVAWLYLKDRANAAAALPQPVILQKISEMTRLLQQQNFEEAKKSASELIGSCRMCIPAYLVLIEAAEKSGDLWESLAQQRVLLELLNGIPSLHARRANVAREIGAHQVADCSVRKAIALEPNNGSHYYLLATIQQAQKQTDAAIESCKKAIELGYEKAPVYVTLGDLYYEKMLLSESIAALAKGIELDPAAAENIASFALNALTTEDYKTLRSVLEKHAEAHPENVNTLYSLATMYLNENNLEKAREYLIRLEKLESQNSQVYYNLALLSTREGNQAEADRALKRFQELKTREQEDWNRHNEAHRTRLKARELMEQKKSKEAILLYSKLVEDGLAENADLLALARLYDASGQYQKSETVLQMLLKSSPSDLDGMHLMITAAEKLGKRDAVEQYRKRLELLRCI